MICTLALIATAVVSDMLPARQPFWEQSVKAVLHIILLTPYIRKPKSTGVHGACCFPVSGNDFKPGGSKRYPGDSVAASIF